MTLESCPLLVQAAILGVVQGICEFLPISSSAHLVVLPKLLGWPYLGKAFDVALHFGTLLALWLHFHKDIKMMVLEWRTSRSLRLLAIATIPAAVAGWLLDPFVERHLHGPYWTGAALILWGLLLGAAESQKFARERTTADLTGKNALSIGWAQALALIPGTSRSGSTIAYGLYLGLTRVEAARFSFLLSIPLILGATLYKGWSTPIPAGQGLPLAIGIVSSAVAGHVCLASFLEYLKKSSLRPFVWYRIAFGIGLLFFEF